MDNLTVNPQLIVGIDPHENILGVVFLYQDTLRKGFPIPNGSKTHFDALIHEATTTAQALNTTPVFVIETTNVFWRPLFSYLRRQNLPVFTVNSYQTNFGRKTKMRKTKTDLIDAKIIAELYRQGKAHQTKFPEGAVFDLRELTRFYSWLGDMKGRLLNRLYAYMFQVFPEASAVFPKKYFSQTVRQLLKHQLFHPTRLSQMSADKLTEFVRQWSHAKYTAKVTQLRTLAQQSTGIPEGQYAFAQIMQILVILYQLLERILNRLELKHIQPLLNSVPHKLNSLKGFSPVAQASFIAELGNPRWFDNADDVLAFFGLDPALAQSARRSGQGKHISKAGTKFGRETMFLAATPCFLHNPVLKRKYFNLRRQGKHYIEAKSILAADLTKICYAMLRDKTEFDPNKIH